MRQQLGMYGFGAGSAMFWPRCALSRNGEVAVNRGTAASVTGYGVYQRSIDRSEGERAGGVASRPLANRGRGQLRQLADKVIAAFSLVA